MAKYPTQQEILVKIAELRSEAKRLMEQASTLVEKAAKLEDMLSRSQKDTDLRADGGKAEE